MRTPQPIRPNISLRNRVTTALKINIHKSAVVFLCSALLLGSCVDDDPVQPEKVGLGWEKVNYPLYNTITCIAIDPDGSIFLGMHDNNWQNTKSQIYISPDNGESWRMKELCGFEIHSLEIDSEGRLFAMGDYCELLRSLDHGECWEELNDDTLTNCRSVIVIDVNDRIYIPTYERGIYMSTDHGDSWVRIHEGLPSGSYLQSLAVNSKGCLFANTSTGLYRSCDSGENWRELEDVPWGESGIQMELDSMDRIFVHHQDNLYVSNDDGENWETLNPPHDIYDIFLDGKDRLFAICGDSLYLSNDGGETWISISGFPHRPYYARMAVNAAGDIFITGIWGIIRSIADGASWQLLGFAYYPPVDIAIGRTGSFHILITYGGVYQSAGDLENWTVFNMGLPNVMFHCLANGPDSTILAGTADGVYISPEDRPDWARAGLSGNRIVKLFTFAGDSLAASTEDNGLFISTDRGTEWRNVGMVGYNTQGLIKTGDGRLVAGANFGGIFRYTGDGILWDQMNSGLTDLRVTALAVISNGDILAGTGSGLFVSADGGASWRRFNTENILVTTICVTGEDILIGTGNSGLLWTRTGFTGLYPQNEGLTDDAVYIIRTDPDRRVYIKIYYELWRSALTLGDISPVGL